MDDRNITEILITEEEIKTRVAELGRQISENYEGQDLVVICVLKGAFIFTADLVRSVRGVNIITEFMAVSSYGNATKSSGVVRILKDLDSDIGGKHVLIMEDIVDSGLTLHYLKEVLAARNPKSLHVCALFDKPTGRKTEMEVEYAGFEVPGRFIVGYGLDFDQKYRNLPYIACMD